MDNESKRTGSFNQASKPVAPSAAAAGTAGGEGQSRAFGWSVAALIGCVVLLAVPAWRYAVESHAVGAAQEQIEAGDFSGAAARLQELAAPGRWLGFHKAEAGCLWAVATIKAYAAAGPDQGDSDVLPEAKQRLQTALAQSVEWRDYAKHTLAGCVADIPADSRDGPARSCDVATLLSDLQLAEPRALGAQLLQRLKAAASPPDGRRAEMPDGPCLARILALDPSQATALPAALLPVKVRPESMPRATTALERCAQLQPASAKALATGLLQQTEPFFSAGTFSVAAVLIDAAERIAPDVRAGVSRQRLRCAELQLDSGDVAGAEQTLDRVVPVGDTAAAQTAACYLRIARRLAAEHADHSRELLAKALQLDGDALRSEQDALLQIDLAPRFDANKLRLCGAFLKSFPDSARRRDVLLAALPPPDFSPGVGQRLTPECAPILVRAAGEVVEQCKQRQVALALMAAAKCLADGGAPADAAALADKLLASDAELDTGKQAELRRLAVVWQHRAAEDRLTSALDVQVVQVGKGSGTRDLRVALASARVVEIMAEFSATDLRPQELQALQDWVTAGGILWVHGSAALLERFGLEANTRPYDGSTRPTPGTRQCLRLAERENIELEPADGDVSGLGCQGRQYPLLVAAGGTAAWSLVPYGRGWISDVKRVRSSGAAAEEFWTQFRRFCLGQVRIDAAQLVREPPKADVDPLGMIETQSELAAALENLSSRRVWWIRLSAEQVERGQLPRLLDWILQRRGVVWVENNLGEAFGFNLKRMPEDVQNTTMQVTKVVHGFKGGEPIGATLGSPPLVMNEAVGNLNRTATIPLIAQETANGRLLISCAVRPAVNFNGGAVVYRPHETHGENAAAFERELLKWSVERSEGKSKK